MEIEMLLRHASPRMPPRLLAELPENHLLRDLIEEHDELLARLDMLDPLIEDYRRAATTPQAREIAARIRTIADELDHAEPHHQREELILFPELERRGVAMPPRIMRREHDELRSWKRKLVGAAGTSRPDTEAVAEAAGTLASLLRDHIQKENEILYPMALTLIRDPSIWKGMRVAARAFGPCCVGCGCKGDV